ncbi:DsbA family protein [Terriglobus sp.]|uniref:DsbA family protein n=1 Tax=Terriglobus sp. TaxID=1889013 RepID=UPI003B00CF96
MKFASLLLCTLLTTAAAVAQGTPASPTAQTAPTAPASADPFPPANPKFFDAASPTTADVNAFLNVIWGYDSNRTWRVEAIQKTAAPNVSKVTVFVADKSQGNKVENLRFFTTPDGKHAIADAVFSFGPHPYDDLRATLQSRADGPSRGAANKTLELVEFADLQCPHCKEAVPIIQDLLRDFPGAHFVFQNFPLIEIHPFAAQGAAYGNCVQQAKGDPAFYTYIDQVFAHQESLTPELAQKTFDNAVTAAGADPAAVKACAATPAARAKVAAQIKLAEDVDIEQTPTLVINGHALAIGAIPYEQLKQIVTWDARQTGASAALAAK